MENDDSFLIYGLWLSIATAILLIIIVPVLASWINSWKSKKPNQEREKQMRRILLPTITVALFFLSGLFFFHANKLRSRDVVEYQGVYGSSLNAYTVAEHRYQRQCCFVAAVFLIVGVGISWKSFEAWREQ